MQRVYGDGRRPEDGKIVMAHSNWSSYADGERWTVVFDIAPASGQHRADGRAPGVITSQDDFGVNAAGLMITETTLPMAKGLDLNGMPEFVRSRKAMQYATTIDEYATIIKRGKQRRLCQLVDDRGPQDRARSATWSWDCSRRRCGERRTAILLSRTLPRDPELIRNETDGFKLNDLSFSPNARRATWEKRMAENKGRIDIEMAEKFLADHDDSYTGKVDADDRSLCGHIDRAKLGVPQWDWGPYFPGGSVTGKVADSDMAGKMSLVAHAGHPCGEDFLAAPFLAAHPEYGYLKPILKDMISGPWTEFSVGEKQ